jgi:hypothetical protein
VLTNQTITTTGQPFTGPANQQYCGMDQGPQACEQWLGTLGLRQDLTYHPGSHFWTLQWAETGILIGLAALLAGFCFWWTPPPRQLTVHSEVQTACISSGLAMTVIDFPSRRHRHGAPRSERAPGWLGDGCRPLRSAVRSGAEESGCIVRASRSVLTGEGT